MTGLTVQRQWLNIIFFQEFLNDPASLATQINIQLQSHSIQVTLFSEFTMELLLALDLCSKNSHRGRAQWPEVHHAQPSLDIESQRDPGQHRGPHHHLPHLLDTTLLQGGGAGGPGSQQDQSAEGGAE